MQDTEIKPGVLQSKNQNITMYNITRMQTSEYSKKKISTGSPHTHFMLAHSVKPDLDITIWQQEVHHYIRAEKLHSVQAFLDSVQLLAQGFSTETLTCHPDLPSDRFMHILARKQFKWAACWISTEWKDWEHEKSLATSYTVESTIWPTVCGHVTFTPKCGSFPNCYDKVAST